jgi:hypothetical protein
MHINTFSGRFDVRCVPFSPIVIGCGHLCTTIVQRRTRETDSDSDQGKTFDALLNRKKEFLSMLQA